MSVRSGLVRGSNEIIQAGAVVPQVFSFALVRERQLQKSFDGVRVFDVEMRVVRGKNHVVFQAIFRNVFCRDLVALDGAVTLALKIFQGRERKIRVFRFACGLGVLAHAPEQPWNPRAVSFKKGDFEPRKSLHDTTEDHIAAGEHIGEGKAEGIEHRESRANVKKSGLGQVDPARLMEAHW